MRWTSEGFRRLGRLCGGLGSLAWLLTLFIISDGFARIHPAGWAIVILGVPIVFAVVVALNWVIEWVVAGFRIDKGSKISNQQAEDLVTRTWTRAGQKKCARCGHPQREHADINTLLIGRCGMCACLDFAIE